MAGPGGFRGGEGPMSWKSQGAESRLEPPERSAARSGARGSPEDTAAHAPRSCEAAVVTL